MMIVNPHIFGVRTYQTESNTLFAAMTVPPDDLHKALIDDFIIELKAQGVWTLLDLFYVLAAHDEQASRLNWVAPGSYTASVTGTPTFVADRGWTGMFASYLDTGWNPTTAPGRLMGVNDAHVMAATLTNTTDTAGVVGNSTLNMNTRGGANSTFRVVQSSSDTASASTAIGIMAANRNVSTDADFYRAGALHSSFVRASSSFNNSNLQICSSNSGTTVSTKQVALVSFGRSLTAGQHLAVRNAYVAFMLALGATPE